MTTEEKIEISYAYIASETDEEVRQSLSDDLAVWIITCAHFGFATVTEKGLEAIDEFMFSYELG